MPILDNNYELPTSGGKYLKFKDGDTKFRVLSEVITWYEYFDNDNKVYRSEEMFKETPNIKEWFWGKPWYQKHFWAMVAYDYEDKKVKILTTTTKAIQSSMLSLLKDPDFGDFKNYDLKVTKTGKWTETTYLVKALPPKTFEDKQAIEEAKKVNLEALYSNWDPFSGESELPF